ncbi:MAG: T9SS type A sorting domain-containing protein [Rhodothermales bacterium]
MSTSGTLSLAVLSLALILPFAAPAPCAQPEADSLAWELVGQPLEAHGLLAAGIADDLPLSVYANGPDGLFVIHSGEEDWTLVALRNDGGFRTNDDTFVSREGTLFGVGFSSLQRSPDGGQTWVYVLDGCGIAPIYTSAGALICNLDGHPSDTIARSTDDGLTWEPIDMWPTLEGRILPLTFATLPVSADLSSGRIVAGGNDAIVYSDDDGFSWEPTNLYAGFRYRINSIVRAPWGLIYAAVNDFAEDDIGGMWESFDGAVWTRVGQISAPPDNGGAQIIALGDSMLCSINPGETQDIQVYCSGDRGRTWAGTGVIAAEEAVGNAVRKEELIVGPEGRLWLGVTGVGPGTEGGVFRTVEPVVPVSAEDGPEPGKPGVELGAAYPNPSSGAVTVPLVLSEVAEVSVVVYDVLGRQVAVLADGRVEAGRHAFALDGGTLPAGLYIVRATVRTDDGTERAFSQRVSIVR